MKIRIQDSEGREQVITLSEDDVRRLVQTADRDNISFGEALQRAIAGGNFLTAVQEEGGRVLIEKDNQLREVVQEVETV